MKYFICLFCFFSTSLAISQTKDTTNTLAKHLLEYESAYDGYMGLNIGINYSHLLNKHVALTTGLNISRFGQSSYQLGLRAYMKNHGSVKPFYELGYSYSYKNNKDYELPAGDAHFIYQKFGVLVDVNNRISISGAIQKNTKLAGKYYGDGYSPSFSLGYKF